MRRIALVALVGFSLISCGRSPEFKKEDELKPVTSFSYSHAVKEMTGSSADILWVIDNSGSMDRYQTQVITNTAKFISSFLKVAKGNDWRMGLLSTDTSDEPYIGFLPSDRLDYTHLDPVRAFQGAVRNLGTNGSGQEKSYDPVKNALTEYPDFLRPQSKLFLILLSDEPEQSRMSTFQFVDFLARKKGKLENVVTYGIFEMRERGCGSNNYQGSRYEEFMTDTNGAAFPICLEDYGSLLAKIGADIGERLVRPRIQLTRRPKDGTLRVLYQGNPLPAGPKEKGGFWFYNYEENAIVFHDLSFAASDNESVKVEYSIDQEP
jgi:hypothetical protein